MNPLFSYYDYRKFLQDYYEQRKTESSFFSYRFMANRIDIEHSTLIKILQGSRHLPSKKVEGVAKLCSFSKEETLYFEALVGFGRAKTDKESRLYFDRLTAMQGVPQLTLARSQYEFFRNWYYGAIWSLLNCISFVGDCAQLSALLVPSVSEKKVSEALQALQELSLITIDASGRYLRTTNNIATGEKWESLAIRQFLQKSCVLAGESIERFPKEERDISAVIVDMPAEKLPEIKDMIFEFRKSLIAKVNSYEKSDRVYQISMQIFPLSKEGTAK